MFDGLGLAWLYESEGFELDSGAYYLPDFWFPALECYGEVKPGALSREEFAKCRSLADPCLLLDGGPEVRGYCLVGGMLDIGELATYEEYIRADWTGSGYGPYSRRSGSSVSVSII